MNKITKELSAENHDSLLAILEARFKKNMSRHIGISWDDVKSRLEADPIKLWSINEMEITGGEPDLIVIDGNAGEYAYFDCSAETPKGRRSICYDREALDSRKENKPVNDALTMAKEMGIEILTEDQYRELQKHGKFDLKTSSWIKTPDSIRKLGGAVFCDRRYDTVFVYHNGAESYYAARGFRGLIRI